MSGYDTALRSIHLGQESNKRLRSRRRSFQSQQQLQITPVDGNEKLPSFPARLLDISETGIGLEVPQALIPGRFVSIQGQIRNAMGVSALNSTARVCWCEESKAGSFRCGLVFQEAPRAAGSAEDPGDTDFYEVLQLNPKADSDTIHRMFRMMAQRYHPDNRETGNDGTFRAILQAYQVLSDPERRAAFDANLENGRKGRVRVLESWKAFQGIAAERRKRDCILSALYSQRATEPHQPTLSMRDFEHLLGCPREELEFTVWYLKEAIYLTRSDNNRFTITIKGVEAFESREAGTENGRLQLSAAAQA